MMQVEFQCKIQLVELSDPPPHPERLKVPRQLLMKSLLTAAHDRYNLACREGSNIHHVTKIQANATSS